MNKKTVLFIILSSFVFGGSGGYLLIRYFIPKLSTVSFLQKYHLAPNLGTVVINTREEIRVNEGSDSIAAIQKAQNWTAALINDTASNPVFAGSAIILSSDGLLATTSASATKTDKLKAAFRDGAILDAKVAAKDPFSNIVFLKVEASGLPTAQLGAAKDLRLSQRILILNNSIIANKSTASVHYLSSENSLQPGSTYYSDSWNSYYQLNDPSLIADSSVLVSLDEKIQGIKAAEQIITPEALQSALGSYFANKMIVRPSYGFYYKIISAVEAKLANSRTGLAVVKVDRPSGSQPAAAFNAGLKEGDLITAIEGKNLDDPGAVEEILFSKRSGDVVKFNVIRGGQLFELNIVAAKKQ